MPSWRPYNYSLCCRYYNWCAAAPLLMSMICFHNTLPENTQEKLVKQFMPPMSKKSRGRSWWPFGRYSDAPANVVSSWISSVTSPHVSHPNSYSLYTLLEKFSTQGKLQISGAPTNARKLSGQLYCDVVYTAKKYLYESHGFAFQIFQGTLIGY